jgi:hypothetical protein
VGCGSLSEHLREQSFGVLEHPIATGMVDMAEFYP